MRSYPNFTLGKLRFLLVLVVFFSICIPINNARADQSFILKWSGSSFDNGATATATLTLNSAGISLLQNPYSQGASETANALGITAFSISVSGASTGNGIFTLNSTNDYFYMKHPGTLDLSQELRDLVNTDMPIIISSYCNVKTGELAYEDLCTEPQRHNT